jgi:hypothetical protein
MRAVTRAATNAALAAALVAALATAVVLGGCGDDTNGDGTGAAADPSSTTTRPSPTTATSAPTTSTTPALAPAATAEDAAGRLLLFWTGGDRTGATTIAESAAVDELFGLAVGAAEARGCNEDTGGPRYCVYRVGETEVQLKIEPAPSGGFVVTQVVLG